MAFDLSSGKKWLQWGEEPPAISSHEIEKTIAKAA
jgi:hypothetical protein